MIKSIFISSNISFLINMENETPKSTRLIAGVVILIVIVGGYLWFKYKDKTAPEAGTEATLGEQVSDQTQTPTDSVPNVNPYEAETNPFEKANPLKDIYKNPFE